MAEAKTTAFPLTSAVASVIAIRSESASTNAELIRLSADSDAWPHLSVLLTEHQTAGRGRLDRRWIAPEGAALAVSVVLRDVPTTIWGWIPLLAGLALRDALATQLPQHNVAVKWPNDVLVAGRKISGILAEVAGGAIILGVGINTRMRPEELPVPTATSFAALGAAHDADRLLRDFLARLGELLDRAGRLGAVTSGVAREVAAASATLGREVRVELPDGATLSGRATHLDSGGHLVVLVGNDEHTISAGDVIHARIDSPV